VAFWDRPYLGSSFLGQIEQLFSVCDGGRGSLLGIPGVNFINQFLPEFTEKNLNQGRIGLFKF
jgi:hypothetical protein